MKNENKNITKTCIVTGETFEAGGKFPYGISPKIKEKLSSGFIVIVGIDRKKSKAVNGVVKPEDIYRSGDVVYIDFKTATKHNLDIKSPIQFIDGNTIDEFKDILIPEEE